MYKGGMRTSALTTTALGGAGIVLLSLASVWALHDGYMIGFGTPPLRAFFRYCRPPHGPRSGFGHSGRSRPRLPDLFCYELTRS